MPVRINCPECDRELKIPENSLGRKVRCPECEATFVAREDEEEPPRKATARRAAPAEETERKSYRDRDVEADRPRRRSDRASAPKAINVLGLISLILGILGLPLSLIPCVGLLALPFVGIGLLLGIIGFFVAHSGQNSGKGLPIAGTLVNVFGLMVTLAWLGVIAYFANKEQTRRAQEEQTIRQGSALAVTAVDLFNHYQDNRADADARYKDKVLKLSGTVAEVNPGMGLDEATVELKTDEEDESVFCHFRWEHREAVARLKPGQPVTIRGKCKGMSLGSVTLEPCVLE
jgi:predicted Zn finger-like uncharacterized protein